VDKSGRIHEKIERQRELHDMMTQQIESWSDEKVYTLCRMYECLISTRGIRTHVFGLRLPHTLCINGLYSDRSRARATIGMKA
jgi:hypothetical protein